jgi:hypothetical protein
MKSLSTKPWYVFSRYGHLLGTVWAPNKRIAHWFALTELKAPEGYFLAKAD